MKSILKLSLLLTLILVVSCSGSDDSPSCTEQTWYQDADGDTYGNASVTQNSCTQPAGFVLDNTDLNDSDANSYPNATEICDGLDNDGDGQVDGLMSFNCGVGEVCENGSCVSETIYYFDADGDGYGDGSNPITAGSTAPTGYVSIAGDCDDTNPSVNPGANDIVDSYLDENCDGATTLSAYLDADNDGYGDYSNVIVFECFLPCDDATQINNMPTGYVLDNTDCDDTNPNINPGATDICGDGLDNDCNGLLDENCVEICDDGVDNDGDGLTDCDDPDCVGMSGC